MMIGWFFLTSFDGGISNFRSPPNPLITGVRQIYALTRTKEIRSGGEKELVDCTGNKLVLHLAGDLWCSGRI